MADIFDKILNKFTSGSNEKRTKQVMLSALALLVLFISAFVWLSFYTVSYRIKAEGTATSFSGKCPLITIALEPEQTDVVAIGQKVKIENIRTGRNFVYFISEVNDTGSYVVASCDGSFSNDINLEEHVTAFIIYYQEKAMNILFKGSL